MKVVYLENTQSGHSKFYRMTEISATEWEAEYGKIGNTPQKTKYSISQWHKKYNEKISKGYKELSHISVTPKQTTDIILEKLQMLLKILEDINQSLLAPAVMNELRVKIQKVKNLIYKHTNLDSLSKDELTELNEIYKHYKGLN